MATLFYRARKLFKNLNDKKSVTGRQVRCNYCMILIIFIDNTSEFAYFFFKSGDSHEGRQRLLVLLSPGGIRIDQFVTKCGGERLPCNNLYVSSVIFMSATV